MWKNLNKITSDEMNVIWKKDKLQKFSKESILSPILASGDGGIEQHCRLCGIASQLQPITDDRLDETLRLYFGVQVPPECAICQSCIKCMKITEGFSALVHASFHKTISEDSSEHTRILAAFSPGTTNLSTNQHEKILTLLNTKLGFEAPRKRRVTQRKSIPKMNSRVTNTKIIIACTACGQKYPMIMPVNGVKQFLCSRCQKNNVSGDCKKTNKPFSVRKIELRCNTDLEGRHRSNSLSKKPLQVKPNQSAMRYDHLTKHQCAQCPKKYAVAEHLATHIKTVHKISQQSFVCSLCGKKFNCKEFLDKHKREHNIGVKIFQCIHCAKYFRSKRALQIHSICHDDSKNKCSSS